jgi:hypothetical protein
MFRPTMAIIRFITDLRGSQYIWVGGGIDKEISCINLLLSYCLVWVNYIQYNN